MRVFITKYALTKGIYEADVRKCEGCPDMVVEQSGWGNYWQKGQWHLTREEAVDRARVMQASKLRALRQQIRKIEALTFEDPNPEAERNEQ